MQTHLKTILQEMCKRVGVNFNKINFKEKEWFIKHEWTEKQENDFKGWLMDYLAKSREARQELMALPTNNRRFIEKFANGFLLNYGWKTKVPILGYKEMGILNTKSKFSRL